MHFDERADVYSLDEIAHATGATEAQVLALTGSRNLVPHADAVRIGRMLVARRRAALEAATLFSLTAARSPLHTSHRMPLAVSGTLHLGILAAIMFTTFGLAPTAATTQTEDRAVETMRLLFLASPGPSARSGGGGGGGLKQAPPPRTAERKGRQTPRAAAAPPEHKPAALAAEPLPAFVAPIIAAQADLRDRTGIFERVASKDDIESHGSGQGGGAGSGSGTGVGEGDGPGVGPGSGGGLGNGPYRPGNGIEPPRLVREVKADYTEAARQRGLAGEVVLEIIVRRDGTVGRISVLRGLDAGLDDRAVRAVRQWRFSPATRLGLPVDVIVEVGVEFRLR